MIRKLVSVLVCMLLLAGVFATVNIFGSVAGASAILYVDDDSGCDGNAPCFSSIQDAVDAAGKKDTVYVFSGNYHESVVIPAKMDGFTLEGQDMFYTVLDGMDTLEVGFELNSKKVDISGFYVTGFESGMSLGTNQNLLHGNAFVTNHNGIRLADGSSSNEIYDNYFYATGTGIWLGSSSNSNEIYSNEILGNGCGIMLYSNSADNVIQENNFDWNTNGILVYDSSSGNRILQNTFTNFQTYAIQMYRSANNNLVEGNVIEGPCTLSGVLCDGIGVQFSDFNEITGNDISDVHIAIYLWGASNNRITENTVQTMAGGLHIGGADNNVVYHNNFLGRYAFADGPNKWDDGYPSGGNYWKNFDNPAEGCFDVDGDGICDDPYVIDGDNIDNYPLVNQWKRSYVDGCGACGGNQPCYNTIQEAVDVATSRETIYICSCTYYESVNIPIEKKQIRLVGEEMYTTILDGQGILEAGLDVYAKDVSISGLTMTGYDYGVYLKSNDNLVFGNVMYVNNKGIQLEDGSNRNDINTNYIVANGDGIWMVSNSVGNEIYSNDIWGNGIGVALNSYSNKNIIRDNEFQWNTNGILVHQYSSKNEILRNHISNFQSFGIQLYRWTDENIVKDNVIEGPCDGNLYLCAGIDIYSSALNHIEGNQIFELEEPLNLWISSNNEIIGNILESNRFGMSIYRSDYNNIQGNHISATQGSGISLWGEASYNDIYENTLVENTRGVYLHTDTTENYVYHNNFIDNLAHPQAMDLGIDNYWGWGYPGPNAWSEYKNWDGGNYWSDHSNSDVNCGPGQTTLCGGDGDGFADTPYIISSTSDSMPYVDPDGWLYMSVINTNKDWWYNSLQRAVDDGGSGNYILANPRTYYENVEVDKRLTLEGYDSATTIIDGSGGTAVTLSGYQASLEYITVTNSDVGVDITGHYGAVSDSIIRDNNIGINVRGYSEVSGNEITSNNDGVVVLESITVAPEAPQGSDWYQGIIIREQELRCVFVGNDGPNHIYDNTHAGLVLDTKCLTSVEDSEVITYNNIGIQVLGRAHLSWLTLPNNDNGIVASGSAASLKAESNWIYVDDTDVLAETGILVEDGAYAWIFDNDIEDYAKGISVQSGSTVPVALNTVLDAPTSAQPEFQEDDSESTTSMELATVAPSVQVDYLAGRVPADIHIKNRYHEFSTDAALTSLEGNDYYLVQIDGPILQRHQLTLEKKGAEILHYMPDNAYVVFMDDKVRDDVEKLSFVSWIGEYLPAYKIDAALMKNGLEESESDSMMEYSILVFKNEGAMQKAVTEVESLGGIVTLQSEVGGILYATLPESMVVDVARIPEVEWINSRGVIATYMNKVKTTNGAYVPQALGFDGTGITGMVQDNGFDSTHPDFDLGDRLTHLGEGGARAHGTSTYGIVFSSGAGDYRAKGMLPNGNGITWDTLQEDNEIGIEGQPFFASLYELNDNDGLFQSNSWGVEQYGSDMGEYFPTTGIIDQTVYEFDLTVLFAAGNSNNGIFEGNLPRTASGKNTITVGGIFHDDDNDRTNDEWREGPCQGTFDFKDGWGCTPSQGPTADGRIKPDIVGPFDGVYTTDSTLPTLDTGGHEGYVDGSDYFDSFGGTSAATPVVAGGVGIIYQMFKEGFLATQSGDNPPSASTVKAVLIANAYQHKLEKASREQQGWGSMDLGQIYRAGASQSITEDYVEAGQTYSVDYVADGITPVKISLVWTDPYGTASADKALINNLDLTVTSPSGVVYYGNCDHKISLWTPDINACDNLYYDDFNNVENVFLELPEAGEWTVTIDGTGIVQDAGDIGFIRGTEDLTEIKEQPFSLVITPVVGDQPLIIDNNLYYNEIGIDVVGNEAMPIIQGNYILGEETQASTDVFGITVDNAFPVIEGNEIEIWGYYGEDGADGSGWYPDGEDGEDGGDAVGIYFVNSAIQSYILSENAFSIYGGDGGYGGDANTLYWVSGDGGNGGSGGDACGIKTDISVELPDSYFDIWEGYGGLGGLGVNGGLDGQSGLDGTAYWTCPI